MKTLAALFLFVSFSVNAAKSELKIIEAATPFAGSSFYYPNDGKEHPGILVLHGSEGGSLPNYKLQAQLLAAHGYAVLAFCWYNCEKNTITGPFEPLENVELRRTYNAFGWLKQTTQVNGKKTGIWGVSRGAEQALIMAWIMSVDNLLLPDAVAVHAPSDVVVMGFNWSSLDKRCYVCSTFDLACFNKSDDPGNWDWNNLHWNPSCGDMPKNPKQQAVYAWRFDGLPLADETRIEIEKYYGPLMITHGDKDDIWSYERSVRIKETMERAGRPAEVHIFEGEGHDFKLPAENERRELVLKFFKMNLN
jgi:dienelactone hydrolase